MSGVSQNLGRVFIDSTEVAQVSDYNYTRTKQQTNRVTSSTAGWNCRTPGNSDITGSITIQIASDHEDPAALRALLESGAQFTLDLYTDGTAQTIKASGPARFEEGSRTMDINDGGDQTISYNWGGDGAWTFPGD